MRGEQSTEGAAVNGEDLAARLGPDGHRLKGVFPQRLITEALTGAQVRGDGFVTGSVDLDHGAETVA